jgi:alkylated DNA nucleotide flippase Atl1
MDVAESTLKGILEGSKQYRVPLYQRPYAWKKRNYRKIWEDLVDLATTRREQPDASHFTGTLVLDIGSVTTESTQLLVVDGQQRLTTLSTLLAAIANEYVRLGDELAAKRIREQVLINAFATSTDSRYRLRPANFDEDVYRSIVDGNPNYNSDSYICDAYRFFERQLRNLGEMFSLTEIENSVQLGLKFVSITAKADDNVYRIFESINNTGVALSQADLIRNLVFMQLGSESELIHETIWKPIQKDLAPEDIENLFWIEAQWRNADVRKLDVYEAQKNHIKGLSNSELISYLENALAIADAMRFVRLIRVEGDKKVANHLERLASLQLPGMLVLITRIIYLRNQGKTTSEEAAEALLVLESYMIRRIIAQIPVSNLGGISAAVASQLHSNVGEEVHRLLSTGRRNYQRDAVIRKIAEEQKVYTPGRVKQLTQILKWLLEVKQDKDKIDFTGMSIEHILPQSLTGEARQEFSRLLEEGEEASEVHEQLVHTLGNLTLTNYNSELSNKAFTIKRAGRLFDTGVNANREIAESLSWGPKEIVSRSQSMAATICELWPGPNELLLDVEPTTMGDKIDAVITVIPKGRWTTYGTIATVVGTVSQVVGNQVTKGHQDGAWRVLRANGEISPGFRWAEGSNQTGREPREVLEGEGIRFDDQGLAYGEFRIESHELQAILEHEAPELFSDESQFNEESEG